MATTATDQALSDWQELYRRRLVSAEEAVAQIKSGDRIWVPLGQRVGLLLAALLGRADELEGVEVTGAAAANMGWFSDEMQRHIRTNILFASFLTREPLAQKQAGYTPWWVWGGHKALEEGRPGAKPLDVAMISVTPPNRSGYCCFGNWLWDAKTAAAHARLVLAEVNDQLPRTFGDTWIHVSEIDAFVEHSQPTPEASAILYPPPEEQDRVIARYVASLIKHRDTIQIGTGSVTGNIPRLGVLNDKEDLGYFAELTVPGMIDLVKNGVITSKYLESHPGTFVTTTAGNDPAEVAYIDDNPMFEFYGVDFMHHPGIIARNDNMVAINNAITIDLTGQIGAGTIGPRIWSGTGGHFAYALGALLSKGGRYICVLPSTAAGGTISRIVPQFEPGQIVTVPRDIADIVVSEYGIAHLLNKTQRERANELIAIAHPDFRAELRREAERLL
ncbi:MAG: acetyl-CoA hydrolase/transferase family protein [Dehalococcoidia bacterium]